MVEYTILSWCPLNWGKIRALHNTSTQKPQQRCYSSRTLVAKVELAFWFESMKMASFRALRMGVGSQHKNGVD